MCNIIAHLNLKRINNTSDLVKIQVRKMGFHIFSFSESWLTDNIPDTQNGIEGYHVIQWDRTWNEGNLRGCKKGGDVGC